MSYQRPGNEDPLDQGTSSTHEVNAAQPLCPYREHFANTLSRGATGAV
jgi:hypothetical protein